ncbi:MAG: hypothetical protein QM628_01130 [Propionicimonas sp.]|jgi:hypothetical protein
MSRLQAGFAHFRHVAATADAFLGHGRYVTEVELAVAEVLS